MRARIQSLRKARVIAGLCCLGTVLAFLTPGTGLAQSTRDLLNRITRLENDVQTLNRAVYKGEVPPPSSYADTQSQASQEVRLQQLENEIRTLTGQLEERDYKVRQLEEKLEMAVSDMNVRLGDLEKGASPAGATRGAPYVNQSAAPVMDYGAGVSGQDGYEWSSEISGAGAEVTGAGAGTSTVATPTATGAGGTAVAAYENAFALLKNNQYDAAEKEFKAFIDANPSHALAGNAKYWLGETYYARGQFDKAARVFAEAYQQYPKNSKAPDNLLKLGMALAGMGKKDDACVALGQIKKEHAGAGPVIRRAEQEMTRLGC